MPAEKLVACKPDGPLGTLIPEGPLHFGRAQLLNDKYHNLPTLFLTRLKSNRPSPVAGQC
jgi:hypothetical protein